jgi:hypothetical protein
MRRQAGCDESDGEQKDKTRDEKNAMQFARFSKPSHLFMLDRPS